MIEEKIIANETKNENRNEILEVRADRLFRDLFNENEMDTIEWTVMQILKADYKDIHEKVTVHSVRLTNTYQDEKAKTVDLIVEYKGEKIIVELNNNYRGNYMKNLLYAFNAVCNHYNVGSNNEDFLKNKIKVILVNLNWYATKELSKKRIAKEEKIIEYPDETIDNEYLIKIININLDFYKKVCYTEIKKWDRLWKLLTIDKYDDLKEFTKNEELLQNYQEKLHDLSNNEEYKKMLLNDNIIANAEREAYFSAGRRDGIEEGIQKGIEKGIEKGIYSNKVEMVNNMHNKGLSIDIISECANLTTLEVEEIIKQNKN